MAEQPRIDITMVTYRDENTQLWHFIIRIEGNMYTTGGGHANELLVRRIGQQNLRNVRLHFRQCERCGTTNAHLHVFEIQHVEYRSNGREVRYLAPQVLCLNHVKDRDVVYHSRSCWCQPQGHR